ncbi:MAG: 1-aminocyclopropane-1-carboxylate deaminase [Candidatus Brocadiaceae bacterium]|nr:1-aminocyclopropane-1-carboxylate deaminase [Candidatus Brocadiaceae bacterium]
MLQENEMYRKVADTCQLDTAEAFCLQSRIHRLQWFGRSDIWVKRDDELSFGVSGTKLRKHASIIPFLKQQGIEEVVVIGGANSNNVLSAAQTLTENRIKITLFLLGPPTRKQGNLRLLSLFVDDSDIHWFSRAQWGRCEEFANAYSAERTLRGLKTFVLPEGAHHRLALPGSLSLPLDILRNEREAGVRFDHIFINSGTGMIAQSLLAVAAALDMKAFFHVVVLAGSYEEFQSGLLRVINTRGIFLAFPLVPYLTTANTTLRPPGRLAALTRRFLRKYNALHGRPALSRTPYILLNCFLRQDKRSATRRSRETYS